MLLRILVIAFIIQAAICHINPEEEALQHSLDTSLEKIPRWSGATRREWISSQNLADLLKLSDTEDLYLPMKIKIVLVGFDGDGNLGIKLSRRAIDTLVGHVQHTFSHVEMRRGEKANLNSNTGIKYRLGDVEVTQLGGQALTTLERFLRSNTRPVDPSEEQPTSFHTDPAVLESVLASLSSFMFGGEKGKAPSSADHYTMFILNLNVAKVVPILAPLLREGETSFGYRSGVSDQERTQILKEVKFAEEVLSFPTRSRDALTSFDPWSNVVASRLASMSPRERADAWASSFETQYFSKTAANDQLPASEILKDYIGSWVIPSKEDQSVDMRKQAAQRFLTRYSKENCLTDIWVGREKLLFVDLSAGSLSKLWWGPTAGGSGIKTQHSLPHLNSLFFDPNKQPDKEPGMKAGIPPAPEPEPFQEPLSPEAMSQLIAERDVLAKFMEDRCSEVFAKKAKTSVVYRACDGFKRKLERLDAFLANDAAALSPDELEESTFISEPEHDPKNAKEPIEEFTHTHVSLLSHLNAVVASAVRQILVPPAAPFLATAHENIRFSFVILKSHNSYAPVSSERFDLAHFESQVRKLKLPSQKFAFRVSEINPHAHPPLASALARASHTRVTPSLSLSGKLTVRKETSIDGEALWREMAEHGFAFNALRWTGDKGFAQFDVYIFLMSHDTPHMTIVAPPSAAETDKHTQQHLETAASGKKSGDRAAPIMAFDFGRPATVMGGESSPLAPIFEHNFNAGQAHLLVFPSNASTTCGDDLSPPTSQYAVVFLSQNIHTDVEMGTMCNGKEIESDMSNPMHSALAAVYTALSGLLPSTFSFDEYNDEVTHNWMWSVGSHPDSLTTSSDGRPVFTQQMISNAHRSWVANGLRASLACVNQAVHVLHDTKTQPEGHDSLGRLPLTNLTSTHRVVVTQWQKSIELLESGDLVTPASKIPALLRSSQKVLEASIITSSTIAESTCVREEVQSFSNRFFYYVASGLIFVAIMLLCCGREEVAAKLQLPT